MSNEKPKCGYELCDGPHKYMTTPPGRFTQYADCPGPVISGEDYHDGPFLCPICGRHLPCRHCNNVAVSTEPEKPVPEDDGLGDSFPAMTKFREDLAARNACTHDTGSYVACKFCGHNMGASDPTSELQERGVTLTAEDLADLDDMELHFSNQDTHPRWSRYRRLVTRLFNDDALKGEPK